VRPGKANREYLRTKRAKFGHLLSMLGEPADPGPDNAPAETAELAEMYRADGMSPDDATRAARDVMRRPDVALAVHARAELGIDPDRLASPWRAGASTSTCRRARATSSAT